MTSSGTPNIILGGFHIGSASFPDEGSTAEVCNLFRSYGHRRIDHARILPLNAPGRAEELMVSSGVVDWAVIDTKIDSTGVKAHSKERMANSIAESTKALGGKEIDVMYLHAPCLDVPFAETMEAMDDAYRKEKFRRFGISDYSSTQVKDLVEIAEKHGYVKPTVYQGQYNAICRLGEQDLFPLLRHEDISFNAYSPSGAGIFSGKVTQDSSNRPSGRWSNNSEFGKTYSSTYLRKELLTAAEKVAAGAKAHGTNGHAVALRWVLHHSALKAEYGDGIVIGASSMDQLRENLDSCAQGPLPHDLVNLVESVWPIAKAAAPRTWRG